jgi:hypothetical protein
LQNEYRKPVITRHRHRRERAPSAPRLAPPEKATPSANYPYNILKIKHNSDRVLDAPHFTPHLFWAIACLDTFEKTGCFDRIDAICFRKRPFQPTLTRTEAMPGNGVNR